MAGGGLLAEEINSPHITLMGVFTLLMRPDFSGLSLPFISYKYL